jgi:hypothetical protein
VQKEHLLTLQVQDRMTPRQQDLCRVLVRVLDHNDHAPLFLQASYSASVDEDAPLGTSVLTVTAVDRDHGANGAVTYSMVSGV